MRHLYKYRNNRRYEIKDLTKRIFIFIKELKPKIKMFSKVF